MNFLKNKLLVFIALPQLSCAVPSERLYLNYYSLTSEMTEVTGTLSPNLGFLRLLSLNTPIFDLVRCSCVENCIIHSTLLDVSIDRSENGVTISERVYGRPCRRLLRLSLGEEPQIVCYGTEGEELDVIEAGSNPRCLCIRGDDEGERIVRHVGER